MPRLLAFPRSSSSRSRSSPGTSRGSDRRSLCSSAGWHLAARFSFCWRDSCSTEDTARASLESRRCSASLGAALWLLGVYHKETSLCVLPLIVAVLVAGRAPVRRLERAEHRAAVHARRARSDRRLAARPRRDRDGEDHGSRRSRLRRRGRFGRGSDHRRPAAVRLGSRGDATRCAAARARCGRAHRARRASSAARSTRSHSARIVSGALSFVFAAQSGVVATRYYIPVYALFAVALSLSLVRLPRFFQVVGVLVIFFAFMPPSETRAEVSRWTDEERCRSSARQGRR